MNENVENLVLERLKAIQAELADSRERDREIIRRLAHLETGQVRIEQSLARTYGEQVEDRHRIDELVTRIDRIERRLDLAE